MDMKCQMCVAEKHLCPNCRDNPIYKTVPKQSFFRVYNPLCPRGFNDCINDPAYIKFYHPEWYKELYGDMTPEEALCIENGCMESFKRDPEMNYYCYDDEDK